MTLDGYDLTIGMLLALLWFSLGVVCGRLEESAERARHRGWPW